jgi:hypothetical protein
VALPSSAVILVKLSSFRNTIEQFLAILARFFHAERQRRGKRGSEENFIPRCFLLSALLLDNFGYGFAALGFCVSLFLANDKGIMPIVY